MGLTVKERHELMARMGVSNRRVKAKIGRILLYIKKQDKLTWKEVGQTIGRSGYYCQKFEHYARWEAYVNACYWVDMTWETFNGYVETNGMTLKEAQALWKTN